MRNNDPIFLPTNDVDLSLKQQRDKNYTDCINILQTQWYQADVDQRFAMADQDIWGLIFPGVATYRRKIFNFNIINPIIQAISGHQRQMRKSTICIPIHSPMQKTADQLTKCLFYVHDKGRLYHLYSDAFEQGSLIQGLGFIGFHIDYSDDPISGDIKGRYIDMKSCLFDPYFRQRDMSDCRFFWTRQFFGKEEAAMLYPQFQDEILSLPKGSYRDDKFYYMPEVYQIQFPNVIAFDEYWYLSSRKAEYLVDIETNECQEFNGDEEDLRAIMQQFRGRLKVIKKARPTVRRSIILNDRTVIDEDNPYGLDCYPIIPSVGYFSPDTPYYAYKFRGVVRDMRDAQYLFNRRKVADLDILESQQQGIKMKQGSLVTPDDALNSGNGRVLVVKKEAMMDDVQQMDIHPPAPAMLQMEEMLMNIVYRISGVDPSSMGIDVDDKAGIISMMRQAATARNLQRLFDQFDEMQRIAGNILIKMIQKNYTYGKVMQIIGEEPTTEFDNKLFFDYGCKIVQGALTETQQQLELAQLMQVQQMYPDLVPPEEILECMTLQNKDRLVQKIQNKQKAQQEQQQQMAQLQMEQMRVDNETKLAYARAEDGLAKERVAKIQTDIAIAEDKLAKSETEDKKQLLDIVKALKEIQGMDIDQINKKLEILHGINNINFDGPQALKEKKELTSVET